MIKIGLEIHAELATKTKLFCSCPRPIENEPNSRCCPVCLGHPGSKPVTNKKAIEYAIKLALALNCSISDKLIFSRKSYFYPDMSKNFQITQYEIPLGSNGSLKLSSGKKIPLKRVHVEEDPAALIHQGDMHESPFVLVDYNRSGNPLVEIVTEPEIKSQMEARDFMKQLITVLEYLEIFDSQCAIKADANISVQESGYRRVEVKNITGFKEIENAVGYEIRRQQEIVRQGKTVKLETRGWDSDKGITYSMRSKETEEDYGYIIEPDLIPIDISRELVEKIAEQIPELAEEKLARYLKSGMEETTAKVIAKDKELAELYDKVSKHVDAELSAKWIRRDVSRALNLHNVSLGNSHINSKNLIELLELIEKNKITDKTGQEILEELAQEDMDIVEYIEKRGLFAIGEDDLDKVCREVINELPDVVSAYKEGEKRAFNKLVGKVMQKTKGKAQPKAVHNILKNMI